MLRSLNSSMAPRSHVLMDNILSPWVLGDTYKDLEEVTLGESRSLPKVSSMYLT
jgi:hypothetical protein